MSRARTLRIAGRDRETQRKQQRYCKPRQRECDHKTGSNASLQTKGANHRAAILHRRSRLEAIAVAMRRNRDAGVHRPFRDGFVLISYSSGTNSATRRSDEAAAGAHLVKSYINGTELVSVPPGQVLYAVGRLDDSKELGASLCYPEGGSGSSDTVSSLGPCARWPGWYRGPAATALVTGPALIPFGRLL